jgi:1,4-dihydroxy-2-naphthoate octaprenyltransferase
VSDRPPTREELAVSLATNAASKPFNIAVAVVAFVVVLLIGAPAFVALLVAVVLYTVAVARTMFDGDEAERVTRKHHDGAGEPDPQPDPPATT